MELIKIVDKNGHFTGQIMDKEEDHDKNLLHYVGWAGHVDVYESLEDADLREAEEELDIKFLTKELHDFSEKITLKATNSHITYFYYIKCNKHEEEFRIQEEELSEVKWFFIDNE